MNIEKTESQQKYLQILIERYTKRTKSSKELTQLYRSVLADRRVSEGFNLPLKEMCYPIVGRRSLGSRIWDVDGNEYVDLIMGLGINLFGHNPPFLREALQEQLEKGIQIGPQAELAGEVAELIGELTGMERVALSNTGTEAMMAAIRLARATTGRNKIAMFSGSYHGHFDAVLVKKQTVNGHPQVVPVAPGIPTSILEDVLVLDYGNPHALDIIKDYQQDLAAVLVEPVQSSRPNLQPKVFLQQLRQLTKELGIALIFDEMITGFRIHPGGAQAWFGVEADIAAYGKVVGGGIPIGIIAGKAIYMDRIDGGLWNYGDTSSPQVEKTMFAGTYCKHPLAMAAANAVLKYLKVQGPALQQQLNQRTSEFVQTLNTYFEAEKMPIRLVNFGSIFSPFSSSNSAHSENSDSSMGMNLLSYHLLDRGVLLRVGGGASFLSTAHTDEDISNIINAVKDSVKELQEGGFL
ncbi:MAG: aspartate aminotransferase family protein [Coleofasciculus sp. B1-GNL1-01]|uniref:aspartate aminotransferase family protein n=1 Tax=Coleofasciculus sp. B1-GNL1-01 TaxID=3068484 RepID=UPI0032FBBE02